MPVYDTGFKIAARTSGRELAEVARLTCSHWRPIVSEVQVTERFADRAFRATFQDTRCFVYFEAFTTWRKGVLWNVLAKAGMLSEREELPTLCVVYILRPRGYVDHNGEFLLQAGNQPTQKLWFFPVPLWQQKPAEWWKSCPGLMTLFPLTQHGLPPKQSVLTAAESIRSSVAESGLRADLLASLAYFGELAYPQIDMTQLIGRDQMKQSKLFQQLFAEEREQALRESQRTFILDALMDRFGKPGIKELSPLISSIEDEQQLAALRRLAVTCKSLEEFRSGLTQP